MNKKYNCKFCNYSTKLKGNFKRHLTTKKHKKNTNNTKKECINTHIYTCEYCSKEYIYPKSLHRHKKECVKNKILQKQLVQQHIQNIQNIQNNIHNTTYNNIINVISRNYPDAPSITDIKFKELSDKEMQKCIDQGVPDGVIRYIKKALLYDRTPENMSFWCIDTARTKYVVKKMKHWKTDIHGVYIKEIMMPILKSIFTKFSAKKNKEISNIHVKSYENIKNIGNCLGFILDIGNKEDKIIKSISSYVKFRH